MTPPISTASRNTILQSAMAVFAGLVAVAITSTAMDAVMRATGVFPGTGAAMSNALFLLATAYRTAFGVLGGYVTARLAPAKPVKHAVILGVIGTLLSLAGAVATWNKPELGPHWYPLALVVISVPSAWLGGKIVSG